MAFKWCKVTLFVPAKIFHLHFQTSCQNFPAMEQGKNMSDTGGETIAISSPALNLISCHSCTRVLGWGQGVQRFRVLWKEKSIQYPGFAYKYVHIKLHILYPKFRISNVIASSDKKKFCVCYWSSIFRSQNL